MADSPEVRRRVVIARLEDLLSRPLDFSLTDSVSTHAKVQLLSIAAVYFNLVEVPVLGGAVRGDGLVEQVVGAAFQTFGGIDPHPGPFEKAAMLVRGITQGHPFADGNKRVGFLLAAYYLRNVGHPLPPLFPEDAVIEFCLRVAAGSIRDLQEITAALQHFWGQPLDTI
jgi:death-on-curing protein